MLPILQKLLFKKYPTLFQNPSADDSSLIIECNDGWFGLIDTLSELILKRSPTTVFEYVQASYGSLSIGITGYCNQNDYDYVFGVTSMAYWLSQIICEKCACKGIMFNSYGITARCEMHDNWISHQREYDETSDLPFQICVSGTMWRHMMLEFYDLTQLHIKNNGMPYVDMKRVEKINGKLEMEFLGGDEVTHGMAALLLTYANKIDEETGEIFN